MSAWWRVVGAGHQRCDDAGLHQTQAQYRYATVYHSIDCNDMKLTMIPEATIAAYRRDARQLVAVDHLLFNTTPPRYHTISTMIPDEVYFVTYSINMFITLHDGELWEFVVDRDISWDDVDSIRNLYAQYMESCAYPLQAFRLLMI
jgi:hypothetical protein